MNTSITLIGIRLRPNVVNRHDTTLRFIGFKRSGMIGGFAFLNFNSSKVLSDQFSIATVSSELEDPCSLVVSKLIGAK